jgi:hypothetical protein
LDGQSGGELIKFKVKADRDRSAATLGVVSCRAWTPSVVRVLLAQAVRASVLARARNLGAFTEYERAGRYWTPDQLKDVEEGFDRLSDEDQRERALQVRFVATKKWEDYEGINARLVPHLARRVLYGPLVTVS